MFKNAEYVYAVYQKQSFSKAAQSLYISQPALSAAIKKTEALVGSPLFDRSATPLQLTACGEEYIRACEKIFRIEQDFSEYLSEVKDLKSGDIAIGCSSFFSSYLLPPVIASFSKHYPSIKIRLIESAALSLDTVFSQECLDFAIDHTTPDAAQYTAVSVLQEHIILAVPKEFPSNASALSYRLTREEIIAGKHLLPSTPVVPLHLFADDPFLLLHLGNDTRERAEKLFHLYQLSPAILLKLEQQSTAYAFACQGLGDTFLSDSLIQSAKPDPRLNFYKLPPEISTREVYFYFKRSQPISHAASLFLSLATEYFARNTK